MKRANSWTISNCNKVAFFLVTSSRSLTEWENARSSNSRWLHCFAYKCDVSCLGIRQIWTTHIILRAQSSKRNKWGRNRKGQRTEWGKNRGNSANFYYICAACLCWCVHAHIISMYSIYVNKVCRPFFLLVTRNMFDFVEEKSPWPLKSHVPHTIIE